LISIEDFALDVGAYQLTDRHDPATGLVLCRMLNHVQKISLADFNSDCDHLILPPGVGCSLL
jgi:hypothetical protein